VDMVLPEPSGGNHWAPLEAAETLKAALLAQLNELLSLSVDELRDQRYAKYRRIGRFLESSTPEALQAL
ncbi:MAG: acetyl-CoA carboxylase carboxyl transferase subunit alpha, partial [Cyanobacteriota bacterium]